jgi:2-Cys peroxiredoxin 5
MASTFALRRFALTAARPARSFHSSARAFIKVGDRLPNLDVLVENSPGNKVNLSELTTTGKALIIGVPAAFSKSQPQLVCTVLVEDDV